MDSVSRALPAHHAYLLFWRVLCGCWIVLSGFLGPVPRGEGEGPEQLGSRVLGSWDIDNGA